MYPVSWFLLFLKCPLYFKDNAPKYRRVIISGSWKFKINLSLQFKIDYNIIGNAGCVSLNRTI